MIYGIGTDIAAIARLQQLWERHGDKGAEKILSVHEMADFAEIKQKGRFLAKRFGAKEALSKALGTGIRPPVVFTAMSVCHDENGKPFFQCTGELAELIAKQKLNIHLSVSDEADYAIAYVLLEQR